ncbi:hypothetical protein [Gellertiella hungarica]|uniref:Uncharacterized protein n=1 Tax=Gellertiella hungarica TaxID=1572859 RepID=A0A7W6JBD1_9HYPH|nr:hypothetical protein [Gellertiella hungarica]MBB4067326.1 hypothetical protein [Gellertiella hungarica]
MSVTNKVQEGICSSLGPFLAATVVLWWVSSSTDIYERVINVNHGAPMTVDLIIELSSIALLLISAIVAGLAVTNRQTIPIRRLHALLAANSIMAGYVMLALLFPVLPDSISILVPLTAIILSGVGYVRGMILKDAADGSK